MGGKAGSSPVASKARFFVKTTEKILNRTNRKKLNDAKSASASKLDLEENEANKQNIMKKYMGRRVTIPRKTPTA